MVGHLNRDVPTVDGYRRRLVQVVPSRRARAVQRDGGGRTAHQRPEGVDRLAGPGIRQVEDRRSLVEGKVVEQDRAGAAARALVPAVDREASQLERRLQNPVAVAARARGEQRRLVRRRIQVGGERPPVAVDDEAERYCAALAGDVDQIKPEVGGDSGEQLRPDSYPRWVARAGKEVAAFRNIRYRED